MAHCFYLMCSVLHILCCPCCEESKKTQRVDPEEVQQERNRMADLLVEQDLHVLQVHEAVCPNDYRYAVLDKGDIVGLKCTARRCRFDKTVSRKALLKWLDNIYPDEYGQGIRNLLTPSPQLESTISGKT